MPIGKRINKNKEKGDKGELLTQKMFGLAPTSGSGCGKFDKQDSKNQWLRAETKVTGKWHYTLNIADFERWRQQAASVRSQFFLHVIHENADGVLDEKNSRVVIKEAYYDAIKPILDSRTAWSESWIEPGAKSVKIDLSEAYGKFITGAPLIYLDIHRGTDFNVVSLPAPYFKELLEKE